MIIEWTDEDGEERKVTAEFDSSDPQQKMAKVMLIGMFNQSLSQQT